MVRWILKDNEENEKKVTSIIWLKPVLAPKKKKKTVYDIIVWMLDQTNK